MKKIFVAVMLMTMLVFVGGIGATEIVVDRVAGYYAGDGGEFNVAGFGMETNSLYGANVLVNNRYGNQGFETFCLEKDEYVTVGGTHYAVVNPHDMAFGGGNNTDTGDTISRGTAYLYSLFSSGSWSSYNYTKGSGREASAEALQNTIWALEDEQTYNPGTFTSILVTKFGSWDNAKLDIDKDYGVGVLNITATNGDRAQDLLVRTPVPEPISLLLLGLGLIGLAGIKRKVR